MPTIHNIPEYGEPFGVGGKFSFFILKRAFIKAATAWDNKNSSDNCSVVFSSSCDSTWSDTKENILAAKATGKSVVLLNMDLMFSDPHSFTEVYEGCLDERQISLYDHPVLVKEKGYGKIEAVSKLMAHIKENATPITHTITRLNRQVDSLNEKILVPIPALHHYKQLPAMKALDRRVKLIEFYMPIELFSHSDELDKSFDVLLSGIGAWDYIPFYPYRMLARKLCDRSRLSVKDTTEEYQSTILKKDFYEYTKAMRLYHSNIVKSKMMVVDGGFPSYPIKKYFEAMLLGCVGIGVPPINNSLYGIIPDYTFIECEADSLTETILRVTKDAAYLHEVRENAMREAEKHLPKNVFSYLMQEALKVACCTEEK